MEKSELGVLSGDLVYLASRKFRHGRGPMLAHEKPKELRTKYRNAELASIFCARSGFFIIDEAFKNAVETLELDTHQFWLMKVTQPDRRPQVARRSRDRSEWPDW